MDTVGIIPAQEKYIKAYWVTLGRVAQERKYLRITHAFPLEETMEFIREGIKNNYPYFFIKSEDAIVGWNNSDRVHMITSFQGNYKMCIRDRSSTQCCF